MRAVCAEEQRLPQEVRQMLGEGRWCATPANWCLKAAGQLQASALPHRHDLTCCLLLVRGAVAAMALVGDTGYEAAVRHLSKECASVAEKVGGIPCGPGRRWCAGKYLCASSHSQLAWLVCGVADTIL